MWRPLLQFVLYFNNLVDVFTAFNENFMKIPWVILMSRTNRRDGQTNISVVQWCIYNYYESKEDETCKVDVSTRKILFSGCEISYWEVIIKQLGLFLRGRGGAAARFKSTAQCGTLTGDCRERIICEGIDTSCISRTLYQVPTLETCSSVHEQCSLGCYMTNTSSHKKKRKAVSS